jgi:phosphate transport system substrate-binding protein
MRFGLGHWRIRSEEKNAMKTLKKGICLNHERCPLSGREEVITVEAGSPFVCPVCTAALEEVQLQKSSRRGMVTALLVILVLFAAAGGGYIFRDKLFHGMIGEAEAHGKVMLRLAGSNTIGDKLGPALAEAYLRAQGATGVYTKAGAVPEVKTVFGTLPGSSDPVEIDVAAHGSATAFTSLADGSCDIGMASRSVKADEIAKLAALGTMTDSANEHILGLDGIAIIVNPHNPLSEISKEELQRIFTGVDDKWQSGGAVNIYARDDKSGTWDTFKNLVLAGKPLSKNAKRFEDSNALSDAVASDPNGIGFIGLPFIRNAKALAISDKGAKPLLPTTLTVATEDYTLSRRLFLYTPANSANANVRDFVAFALSPAGQQVVAANGFIAQTTDPVAQKVAPDAPPEYQSLTANAKRFPIDFRFLNGKTQLDNRALADMDRIVAQLTKSGNTQVRILLFGFSDSSGSSSANLAISRDRAHAVAGELSRRGITPAVVEGFGAALPVASNDTPEGRDKNRRVEIWIGGENAQAGAL